MNKGSKIAFIAVKARAHFNGVAVSPKPRNTPFATSHTVAVGAPSAAVLKYQSAWLAIGLVEATPNAWSRRGASSITPKPWTAPTTSARHSAAAILLSLASPSAATKEMDVRNNGSFDSLPSAYCALTAAPAPPSAVAPRRPMYAVSTSRATGSAANWTTAGRAIERNSRLRPFSSAASPLAAARRPTLGRLGRPSCSAAVRADATATSVSSVVRIAFVIALPCDCDNEGWCCYGQGSLRWRARLVVL
mmetsp:Transcript_20473/g.63303  ORF Transcript_20473/g.63303 Transcript_20473/m.63303 type:complete len:248 (-) Transcript_20473:70-813(-)